MTIYFRYMVIPYYLYHYLYSDLYFILLYLYLFIKGKYVILKKHHRYIKRFIYQDTRMYEERNHYYT